MRRVFSCLLEFTIQKKCTNDCKIVSKTVVLCTPELGKKYWMQARLYNLKILLELEFIICILCVCVNTPRTMHWSTTGEYQPTQSNTYSVLKYYSEEALIL